MGEASRPLIAHAAAGRASRTAAQIRGYSIEVSARDRAAIDALPDRVPQGTDVYITWTPRNSHPETAEAAARLRRIGMNPVPHIAARYIESAASLADLLARLDGSAGIDQALLVGGDVSKPAGPFAAVIDLLRSGLLERHGITRIGVAGYPEGHPKIAADVLDAALRAKIAYARENGLTPTIVTQFCFEADAILGWLAALRRGGIDLPVRVGLAGPASIATLMRYAVMCGIGNSIKVIGAHRSAIARLFSEADPGRIVDRVQRAREADPALGIAGFHFFPFGGIAKFADWLNR